MTLSRRERGHGTSIAPARAATGRGIDSSPDRRGGIPDFRLSRGGLSCRVILTRPLGGSRHRAIGPSRTRKIREMRKALAASTRRSVALAGARTRAPVCARARPHDGHTQPRGPFHPGEREVFPSPGENCVGMVNGRHDGRGPSAMPRERIPPANSDEKYVAGKKEGRVSARRASRLPPGTS